MKYSIGAYVGVSHISCAVIDIENETIISNSNASVKVDNKASSRAILNLWAEALLKSISHIDKNDLAGIGFAMPGPFDYENGIGMFTREVAKYENLFGVNITSELAKLLSLKGNSQFRFINEATSFAIGEAWFGMAKGYKRSVSLKLGTDFGSAFIEFGIPVVNHNDVPNHGCLWHLPYQNGIANNYFSSRWFVDKYYEKTGKILPGVKEIANEAEHTEIAIAIFKEFGENLGRFIGEWLKRFRAEKLVIGGNVAGAYPIFGEFFEKSLQKQAIEVSISLSELKEDAALVGSARLFDRLFWENVKPLLKFM